MVPYEAFNFVLDQAGGPFKVTGDFLYETYQQSAGLGTWGLLRVEDGVVAVTGTTQVGNALTVSGTYQPTAADAGKPATIRISSPSGPLGEASVSGHSWTFTTEHSPSDPVTLTVRCSLGGETKIALPPPALTAPEKVAGNPVSKGAPTRP